MTARTPASQELGFRLRTARLQAGHSLGQVEKHSGGRFKAVSIGSYERGDRAITVQKITDYADWLGVPVSALIPGAENGQMPLSALLGIRHHARQVKAASEALGADCEALDAAIEAALRDAQEASAS